MFYAHPTLLQAAMTIGIDPAYVNIIGSPVNSQGSCLHFGSVKTEVFQAGNGENLISATFTPDDMDLSFQTRFMEPDYRALANIIEAVVNEKMYSSPWVTHGAVAKVSSDVSIGSEFIHNHAITTVSLICKDGSGCDNTTSVDVVATVGNKPFSYCYALYAGEELLLSIDKETCLDKLTSRLAKGIEDYYNTWKASLDTPAPTADDYSPLEQLYEAVKEHCEKHPDANAAIPFKMSKSFSVGMNGTDNGHLITYDPTTKEILVYQYTHKWNNEYYYRLFLRADTINEETKNRIMYFVCSKNRGLF